MDLNSQVKDTYKYTNHLIRESSPYLLQHAHNPVDWYPWSEEALEKARKEDKPIFLSIGYASCHWCHVMERESFKDEMIAKILREHFISIKVDREQRPDLDQIYMAATQAVTGSGGWPMSVFLTPDLKPFFAGTYFPPEDRYGRPGFKRLLTELIEMYETDRARIEDYAGRLVTALQSSYRASTDSVLPDRSIVMLAAESLLNNYDRIHGGFGNAPKFPHPTELSFLMKIYANSGRTEILAAIEQTLTSMARGGIYDQIGGGFHRYATDSLWLVPHFEKMLYDNAMLAVVYSEAFQLTQKDFYRKIVRETLDFMIREMKDGSGGFYSSIDADSESEEGRFYVWTRAEIKRLLGDRSDIFCHYFNITEKGNFEGNTNIPNIDNSSIEYKTGFGLDDGQFEKVIDESRKILFEVRSKRVRPVTDDKILTSWNGLAISGLAKGYQVTGNIRYREVALKAADFIKENLYHDGKLIHSYRQGVISPGLFLEDYAYLAAGLIDLYEISYDYDWINMAAGLAGEAVDLFSDESGNLFLSPANQSDHFMRPRDIGDGALPAPGSILIQVFLKLADITGRETFAKQAEKSLELLSGNMIGMPSGLISAVTALDFRYSPKTEIVVVGRQDRTVLMDVIYRHYLPHRVIVVSDRGDEAIPLLEGRGNDTTIAYVCRDFACQRPARTPDELKRQLNPFRFPL
nr:thioredoxin domain-containing protein [candidate division Zixibacteria bacterium]